MAVAERFPKDAVESLRERLSGEVVTPGDAAYGEARAVWNGTVDRHPAVVVRCQITEDVVVTLATAREYDLPVAVRGGGHNVAGTAVCDDGLVVDLSGMTAVVVDPEARTARVAGGATWAEVDAATQRHGLATPGGLVSDTGVGGLTLGGGLGHLRRKYGLSCDNVVSMEVVLADGSVVTASADDHPELYWALRGGGGNFGVVTEFTFDLHPVGPEVFGLLVFHPFDRAVDLFRQFRAYAEDAPDEASVVAFCAWVPDAEEFPEAVRGRPAVAFLGCHSGSVEEGERALAPVRAFADSLVDLSGPYQYTEFQQFLDADYPDGMRYYWKSLNLDGLSDGAIETLVAAAERAPSHRSTVDVWHLGGAIARIPADETAYAHRDVEFLFCPEANWEAESEDDVNVAWARETIEAMRPYGAEGGYVNFPGLGEEGTAGVRATYGGNYERLARVKARYDPENLFRSNQNVRPAA
ncbi:FAD-binding oxidoreductase [Halomarina litorea]|uniref:FAD-binding oxidoreductase n=1 Tax=Halomarina litorea TaxID=2961595 RepID=UPI0020C278F6|nr:FAD-binding oxidoreductase [Halomarina sp. BCD28]